MKLSSVIVAASAALGSAEVTASLLTFTYFTFTDEQVKTATTTYGSVKANSTASSTHSAVSSYKVNPSDLAYPTYPNVSAALADDPAAPGLLNGTQFALEALELVELVKSANATNCQTCKNVMSTVVEAMKVQQELLFNIAQPFCASLTDILPLGICLGLLRVTSTDIGAIFPAMDMQGTDGQTLCAFMFGTCDLPAPPQFDISTMCKGVAKPAPKRLTSGRREPLKVLHISDYHLDQRYVVGSEADCGGALCCRVFPYTNVSTPIVEPASLFGNYQCDTPEALATSLFRQLPNATNLSWSDFSFGIFTGNPLSLCYCTNKLI